MKDKGVVFNIQKYSVNDGSGVRTVVFLKGCPLACAWCSNPESQRMESQLLFTPDKCIQCGNCAKVCPNDPEDCTACGKCAEVCYAEAKELSGKEMTVGEVLAEVEKDRIFYKNSGGGVTLSGGEALMQWEFAAALAEALKTKLFLNVAIETTGFQQYDKAYAVLKNCDTVLYDLKHMDDERHKKFTGVSNKLILENARRLADAGVHLIYRIPLLGGINDDGENIDAVIKFALETGVKEVHLLPYHEFGRAKYAKIGKEYDCDAHTPDDAEVEAIKNKMTEKGLNVRIGG